VSDKELFLARWSRRKRQAAEAKGEGPKQAAPNEGVSGASTASQLVLSSSGNDRPFPEVSTEEIALLPRIEDLTPSTDLTQFLRKGVPAHLRNAALRRMWALEPAIRDYVNAAREYAYDWNTPGGVPGSGPFLTTDDVSAMVQRITGGTEQPLDDAGGATGALARNGEPLTRPSEGLLRDPEERSCNLQEIPKLAGTPEAALDEGLEPISHDQASSGDLGKRQEERVRRRHGTATPT
jgi:hypothetical protein